MNRLAILARVISLMSYCIVIKALWRRKRIAGGEQKSGTSEWGKGERQRKRGGGVEGGAGVG